MITALKAQALMTFAHSRLSGKMSTADVRTALDDQAAQDVLDEMEATLKADRYTVDDLNNMPNNFTAAQLTYYYELCLKEFSKNIKAGDEMIESVLGLNILVHLTEHKKAVSVDANIKSILDRFMKVTKQKDRRLVIKMMIIAQRIVRSLENANYSVWLRRQRKLRKKK